ncbi:MAG: recX [Clostridia bacterium]|jgi:regulatory protein|nr:recX [Clostridia bacterium]
MRITDITQQKKNKDFFNIFVDGEYYCSLDDESIYNMKLKIGTEVDAELLTKTAAHSAYKKALNYSLTLLGRYSKTEKELARKLKEKEYDSETIDKVINKLKELGYINDEMYVEAFIRSKKSGGSTVNKKVLYNKLMQKGIAREIVEKCLNSEEIDEYDIAMKAAQKKLKNLKGTEREKKSKLYAYLYGKGFEYDTCSKVVNNIEVME